MTVKEETPTAGKQENGFGKDQKVAVQCFAEHLCLLSSLVLRINICGENRHLRQARNRQVVKKLHSRCILAQ